MIAMALLGFGGVLIVASGVLAMIREERRGTRRLPRV